MSAAESKMPAKIWITMEDHTASRAGAFRRWHASDLDHGDEYPVYIRADLVEQMAAALREFDCPRPCNGRPDDFSVRQCVGAGECGCGANHALQAYEAAQPANQAEAVPVAGVIPGDGNARDNGAIDAMAWREGEFTKPLYAAPLAKYRVVGRE